MKNKLGKMPKILVWLTSSTAAVIRVLLKQTFGMKILIQFDFMMIYELWNDALRYQSIPKYSSVSLRREKKTRKNRDSDSTHCRCERGKSKRVKNDIELIEEIWIQRLGLAVSFFPRC